MFARIGVVAAVAVALVAGAGCKSTSATPGGTAGSSSASASAHLGDLATSLDTVRAAFNAHKERPRFVTLVAPT